MKWFATDLDWLLPFEAEARSTYGSRLHARLSVDAFSADPAVSQRLTYRVDGVDANGMAPSATLSVVFSSAPEPHGIPPRDWPRVYSSGPPPNRAVVGEEAYHRHADGALCLWYPADPPERRWVSSMGLASLLVLAERHLFLEHAAALTGEWVAEAAEHSPWDEVRVARAALAGSRS